MTSVGKRQTSVTPSQATALADGYKGGATIGELAERAGLHRQTVIRYLVRAGIELPRRGLSDAQARVAAELYVGGLTLVEVGEHLGVSEGTIRTCLRRQGVERRPGGKTLRCDVITERRQPPHPVNDQYPCRRRYDVTTR